MKNKKLEIGVIVFLSVTLIVCCVLLAVFCIRQSSSSSSYTEVHSFSMWEDEAETWDEVLAIENGNLTQINLIDGERGRSYIFAEDVVAAEYLDFPYYIIFTRSDDNVYALSTDYDTMQAIWDGHPEEVAYNYCLGQGSLDDYLAEYNSIKTERKLAGSDLYCEEAFAMLLYQNGGYILSVTSAE